MRNMNRTGRRVRLAATTAVGLAAVAAMSGCGLSDGDEQVCAAAASGNAYHVYDVASLADDKDIAQQAARIRPGSSDAGDAQAMKKIVELCDDKGYERPGQ